MLPKAALISTASVQGDRSLLDSGHKESKTNIWLHRALMQQATWYTSTMLKTISSRLPSSLRPSSTGSGAGSHTPKPSAQRAGKADWPGPTPLLLQARCHREWRSAAQRHTHAKCCAGPTGSGAGSHTPTSSARRAGKADWPGLSPIATPGTLP
jgi:hypothetical protein